MTWEFLTPQGRRQKIKTGGAHWGQFRFSVTGELLSRPPPKGRLQPAFQRLAQKNYQHPPDANR